METYVTVSFWMMIVALIIRLLVLSVASYPRTEEKTIGGDIVTIIISIGFIVWAGFLLYGGQNV